MTARNWPITAARRLPYLVTLCLAIGYGGASQGSTFKDSLDGKFDMSSYLSENAFGFLPVPIIVSEPAVDQGLGLAGLFFHEDDEAALARKESMATSDTPSQYLIPPSVSAVAGVYTGNESYLVAGGHFGFYNQGKLRYEGALGYGDIKLDYYSFEGIDLPQPLSIRSEALFVSNTVKFKAGDLPLYIGPTQTYIGAELSPRKLVDWLPPQTPPDLVDELTEFLTSDVTTSGIGVEMEFDTRDNLFTPTQGLVYELSVLTYHDAIGSDVDYSSWEFAGLNYFTLNEHWRLALRLEAEAVYSDDILPPFSIPGINLRGVPAARYQGERVAVVEMEATWQFTPRWSALGFIGSGWADNSTAELFSSGSKVSSGIGMRYNIARLYGMHVGLDVARGPEDTVWYIQVGSAW